MIRKLNRGMKIFLNVLILVLFVSCSNKDLTLEECAKYPVKFSKQKVLFPNNDFSILIPISWDWKVEKYEAENIILGIDAVSSPTIEGFVDIISIQKRKSLGDMNDFDSEFQHLLALANEQSTSIKILKWGKTDVLKNESYYIHSKSDTDTYGEVESFTFLLESNEEGIYYQITAGASQTKDLKMNMAVLIQSVKTFRTDLVN
jgi:hypothetical protein